MTRYLVGYHFIPSKSLTSKILMVLGRSRLTHVYISLSSDGEIIYYNCSWTVSTSWHTSSTAVPYDSVYEELDLDLGMVDLVLPADEPYHLWRAVMHFFTTRPRHTLTCVEAVHRLRFLAGKRTKGRTTGGLYRYLKERLSDQR